MKLVVNTNILFSIFKKDSFTRKLITNEKFRQRFRLYSPEQCLKELLNYKDEICKKAEISKEVFHEILSDIISEGLVKFVSLSQYEKFLEMAKEISPDPNDIDIFALALKLNCPIWSNDKELKKQNVVKVYSTKELIEEFGLEI